MPGPTSNSLSETRLLADERFLRKVAYAYYEDGFSQEAIANMEFCSRQTISKVLQKAKERGIVRVSIIPDLRTGYLRNLSRDARMALGLEDLILVSGQNMSKISTDDFLDEVVMQIANAAAEYLDQMVTDADTLAVSGGRTFMRNLVRSLKPTRVLPHMQVVATVGHVEHRVNTEDANLIAQDLAEAYAANPYWFPGPAFLFSTEQVQQAWQFPLIKEVRKLIEQATITILEPQTVNIITELTRRGILSQEQIEKIETYHPVASINYWLFDAQGRCINELLDSPPYFLSGLEIPQLKHRITQSHAKVILVAGGSPSCVPAIRAILQAGLANILITDHSTVQLLLALDERA